MKKKFDWLQLTLGVILNILMAIAFWLIYYAYIVQPRAFEVDAANSLNNWQQLCGQNINNK